MTVLKCIPIHGSGSPTYSASDIRDMLAALLGGTNFEGVSPGIGAIARGHGIMSSPAMAVTANGTPNNHVFVAAGLAAVRGTQNNDQGPYICPLSASFDITVPAAHASLDRKDLIVAQVKDAEFAAFVGNVWTPELVQGTPAGSPVDPTVPEDCLVLARLLVRDSTEAGGTIVRPQDITDLRVHARANGGITPVASTASAASPQPNDIVWSLADRSLYARNAANSAWDLVSPIIYQSTDPGAVGAFRLWRNTATGKRALLERNSANTGWDVLEAYDWVPYTPTYPGMFAVGNAIHFARYIRKGPLVVINGFFRAGSTTSFAGMTNLAVGLPTSALAKDLDSFVGYPGVPTAEFTGHTGARCQIGATTFAGIGVVSHAGPSKALDRLHFIATAGSSASWGQTVPATWAAGDRFTYFVEYEPATLADASWV